MKEQLIHQAYEIAKERYAELGVDTEKVLQQLQDFHLSMHCWQADDVKGFTTILANPMKIYYNVTARAEKE